MDDLEDFDEEEEKIEYGSLLDTDDLSELGGIPSPFPYLNEDSEVWGEPEDDDDEEEEDDGLGGVPVI